MRILELAVPDSDAELAADRLWACGARAVEERPGRAGLIELRTMLASDDEVSRLRLGPIPPSWALGFVDFDPVPADTWREHAETVVVTDGLVIRPAWVRGRSRSGSTEVVIEPAGSFGLGDHPTTRLCAGAVHRLVTEHARPPTRVLDVGCGSGVLAIIAALHGVTRIEAIDIAEAAREATDDNARRNGVEHVVRAGTTPLSEVDGEFDLVVANILAPTLVSMSADLRRVTAAEGVLVISGILADRHRHVIEALRPMRVTRTDELDGWAVVELRHA